MRDSLCPLVRQLVKILHFQVLYRKWPFGKETEWLCRLANSGQATPIFMSSFAIMAIGMVSHKISEITFFGHKY